MKCHVVEAEQTVKSLDEKRSDGTVIVELKRKNKEPRTGRMDRRGVEPVPIVREEIVIRRQGPAQNIGRGSQ